MKPDLGKIEEDSASISYAEIEAESSKLDHWAFVRYKSGLALRREALERSLEYYADLIADPDNNWELDTLMRAAAVVRGGISAIDKAEKELVYNKSD